MNNNKYEYQTAMCLLCNNNCVVPPPSSQNLTEEVRPREPGPLQLKDELNAIFIVRNILEIPAKLLEVHLKEGRLVGNPSEWAFKLCEKCGKEVDRCKKIYEELLDVAKRYRKLKEEIIGKVKRSSCCNPGENEKRQSRFTKRKDEFGGGGGGNWMDVREMFRDFVIRNNYGPFTDPFPPGDLRAAELLAAWVVVKEEIEEFNLDTVEGSLDNSDDAFYKRASKKMRRGRPMKTPMKDGFEDGTTSPAPDEVQNSDDEVEEGNDENLSEPDADSEEDIPLPATTTQHLKKGRGRPPKAKKEVSGTTPKRKGRPRLRPVKQRTNVKCPICQQLIAKKSRVHEVYEHLINCKNPGNETTQEVQVKLACWLCNDFQIPNNSPQDCMRFAEHVGVCTKTVGAEQDSGGKGTRAVPLSVRLFYCDICEPRKHYNLEGFLEHYLDHKKRKYKCFHADCSNSKNMFKYPESVNAHWRVHHLDNGYKSTPCNSRYTEISSLPSIQWWCSLCHQYFRDDDEREQHVQMEHPDSSKSTAPYEYHCTWCTKSYETLDLLNLHQGTIHLEQTKYLKCDLCQDYFQNEKTLQLHKLAKHKDALERRRCLCDHCGQTFGTQIVLDHHIIRVHKPELRKHMCPSCGEKFVTKQQLKVHTSKYHLEPMETNPLECPHCKKIFGSMPNRKLHVETVHEKKYRFKCHHCERGFSTGTTFKKHLACTHGEGTYGIWKCDWAACKKVFKGSTAYHAHMARHRKEPEYECTYCKRDFYSKQQLQVHLLIHTHPDLKPFECQLCPLKFRVKAHLKLHVNMHQKKGDDVAGMLAYLKTKFNDHLKLNNPIPKVKKKS